MKRNPGHYALTINGKNKVSYWDGEQWDILIFNSDSVKIYEKEIFKQLEENKKMKDLLREVSNLENVHAVEFKQLMEHSIEFQSTILSKIKQFI